jgi:hypothetical protein
MVITSLWMNPSFHQRQYSIRRSWRRLLQEAIFEFQIELLKVAMVGNAKMTRKIPAIAQRVI